MFAKILSGRFVVCAGSVFFGGKSADPYALVPNLDKGINVYTDALVLTRRGFPATGLTSSRVSAILFNRYDAKVLPSIIKVSPLM